MQDDHRSSSESTTSNPPQQRPLPGISISAAGATSHSAGEWDNYASSPSYRRPPPVRERWVTKQAVQPPTLPLVVQPASVSEDRTPRRKSRRLLKQSSGPQHTQSPRDGYEPEDLSLSSSEDEVVDDAISDPDYHPKPRKRQQATCTPRVTRQPPVAKRGRPVPIFCPRAPSRTDNNSPSPPPRRPRPRRFSQRESVIKCAQPKPVAQSQDDDPQHPEASSGDDARP